MYIVASKKRSGSKVHVYYHLVEAVRTPKGPRQRVVLSLGKLEHIPAERIGLLGKLIDRRLSGQKRLLPPEAEEESLQREAERIAELVVAKRAEHTEEGERVSVNPQGIEVSQAVSLGPVHAGVAMWRRLGLDEMLAEAGLSRRQRHCAMVEVVARLVHPASELATSRWVGRTALAEVLGEQLPPIGKDALYRVSDRLWAAREQIETALAGVERRLFDLAETMVLYDLTSTYFEGEAAANPKAKRGYSRDRRGDCTQLVVGVVLDEAGFPKASESWEGNTADSTTLAGMLDRLEHRRSGAGEGPPTVVVDRGISSEANLALLAARGYHYITGLASQSREEWVEEIAAAEFVQLDEHHPEISVCRRSRGGEAFLLVRSAERIAKDQAIRERFRERLEAELHRIAAALASATLSAAQARERIGRARERCRRASRLFHAEVVETEAGPRLDWYRRDERLARAEALDGVYILRTDRTELTTEELWHLYMMLQHVERSFRYLKSALGVRPNYHQLEHRCDAHVFISLLAYHLLHVAEQLLRSHGDHRSWPTILEELETHRVLTVTFDDVAGRQHHLRLATTPTEAQKTIYRMLGISAYPLPKKRYMVDPERSHET